MARARPAPCRCRRRTGGRQRTRSASAASSIRPPRLTFTTTAPRGIAAMSSRVSRPRLSDVSGMWSEVTSARRTASGRSATPPTQRRPIAPRRAPGPAVASTAMTCMSIARARRTIWRPLAPRPITSSVRPLSWRPTGATSDVASTTAREVARAAQDQHREQQRVLREAARGREPGLVRDRDPVRLQRAAG